MPGGFFYLEMPKERISSKTRKNNDDKRAFKDVGSWRKHSESMRFWRMYNKNGVMKVLASMCKNVDGMIVNGEEAELRIE